MWSPVSPNEMKWEELYPTFTNDDGIKKNVQFADIGCGYGGLLSRPICFEST